MHDVQRRGMSRIVLLSIIVVAIVGLVAGAILLRQARQAAAVTAAYEDGRAAYESGDWELAVRELGKYIRANPGDPNALLLFADAQLQRRPLTDGHIGGAISAHRQLLRAHERDESVHELLRLYEAIRNTTELEYFAEERLASKPDDLRAQLSLARVYVTRDQPDLALERLQRSIEQLDRPADDETCGVEVQMRAALANLLLIAEADGARDEARRLVDEAVERCPGRGARVARAGTLLRLAAEGGEDEAEALREAAREDLRAADSAPIEDPTHVLAASRLWLSLGEMDRAAAEIERAEGITEAQLSGYVVNPLDWRVALFRAHSSLLIEQGRFADAAAAAEEILESAAETPVAPALLPEAAEMMLAADRVEEGRALFERYRSFLEASQPTALNAPETQMLEAAVLSAEGRPYRVISLLEPLQRVPEFTAPARRLLANAYVNTGQSGRAAQLGAGRATVGPWLATQVQQALDRGEPRAALTLLEPAGDAPPPGVETLRFAARLALASQEDRPLAPLRSELETFCEQHPELVRPRLLLATALLSEGDASAAERVLRSAMEIPNDGLAAAAALVRVHLQNEEPNKALAVASEATDARPESANAWVLLASVHEALNELEAARAAFATGRDATIDDELIRLNEQAAAFELRRGDREAGLAQLRDLRTEAPENLSVRVRLLDQPESMRDVAEAQQLVHELRDIEGQNGLEWRIQQARLWLASGKGPANREALRSMLQYVIDADPTRAEPYLLLGGAFQEAGELSNAEVVYRQGYAATQTMALGNQLLALLQQQQRFADANDVLTQLQDRMSQRAASQLRVDLALQAGELDTALGELQERVASDVHDPDDALRLGLLTYQATGDVEESLRIVQNEPNAPRLAAVRVQTSILLADGRIDDARAILDDLVSDEQSSAAYLLRASFHLRAGNVDRAEADFQALAAQSESDFGPLALGEFYARQDRLDEAEQTWRDGLGQFPGSRGLRVALAQAALASDTPDGRERAAALLDELRELGADDAGYRWVQAAYLASDPDAERRLGALEALRAAVSAPPASAVIYERLARLALQVNQPRLSLALAERGLSIHGAQLALSKAAARASVLDGSLEAARGHARAALQAAPEDWEALRLATDIARFRDERSELRQYEPQLRAALETVEPPTEPYLALAAVYQALDRSADARSLLAEFAETPTGSEAIGVQLALADLLIEAGSFDEAEARLARAEQLAPEAAVVAQSRMRLAAERGDDARVERLGRETLASARPDVELLITAGGLLAGRPAYASAATTFLKRAAELDRRRPGVWASLGVLAYQRGDYDEAERAFRELVALAPNDPDALNNLAWVVGREGASSSALQEALPLAQRAVELSPRDVEFRDTLANILMRMSDRLADAQLEWERVLELLPANDDRRATALVRLAQASRALNSEAPVEAWLREADRIASQAEAAGQANPLAAEDRQWLRENRDPS